MFLLELVLWTLMGLVFGCIICAAVAIIDEVKHMNSLERASARASAVMPEHVPVAGLTYVIILVVYVVLGVVAATIFGKRYSRFERLRQGSNVVGD